MSNTRKFVRFALAGATLALLAGSAGLSATTSQRVDDFQLADQNYLARHLYKMSDAKAIVMISYQAGDSTIAKDAPAYKALKDAYASKGVEFLMIDSKAGETRATVAADTAVASLNIPILFDYNQIVGEGLDLTRAAEVIVINPKDWTVAFRGPVGHASTKRALDSLVAGNSVKLPAAAPKGGLIALPLKAAVTKRTEVTYVKDIAPIVQAKCVACHQPGGIGPMTLTNYDQIRGHAPMIREVIRTQRMPPYAADATVGHFTDDDRLSGDQIKTLVHWIEDGAKRGAGDDPLAKISFQAPEWPLGRKPDIIVDLPEQKVPATGRIPYTTPVVPAVMTEGRWMQATAFRISDRQVVHHILTSIVPGAPQPGSAAPGNANAGVSIGGYGPGRLANTTPKDMGVWIPPSGGVSFQNHYTPYGKETVERTQMGIYFYPKGQEPLYPMRTFGIFDFGITIPAGAEWHPESAYIDIPKDAWIYGITPHAHHRGSSAQVAIRYPDGHEEMLLSLPHYDFNWQYEFYLAEPLKAPAGSKIITRWTYDNSTRNKDNPDPTKEVVWGEQSDEEMLAMYLHYRWDGETTKSLHDDYDRLLSAGQLMGVLDDNIDGKLQLTELRGRTAAALKTNFAMLDRNGDRALDPTEMAAAGGRGGGGAPARAASAAPATGAAGRGTPPSGANTATAPRTN